VRIHGSVRDTQVHLDDDRRPMVSVDLAMGSDPDAAEPLRVAALRHSLIMAVRGREPPDRVPTIPRSAIDTGLGVRHACTAVTDQSNS
jgi:hypothetical protein